MDDVRQRIANLSPEKRALFELRLMQQRTAHTPMEAIPRRDSTAPCALSFAQQRLWFLAQLEPHSARYHEPKVARIHGALDIGLLQQTLEVIVARHEALRTTFVTIDGTPMQVIAEKQSVALPVLDLRAWPEATREAEVQRHLHEAIQRPFDLTRGVLLRALVIRVRDEDHVLLLVLHHIASDGWSVGVLFREIDAFYTAFATGNPVALPELPIQYADYALWQHQWLQGERLAEQLAYWKQQLAGAPRLLELPTDHPRPTMQTWHGTRQTWVFPASLTADLAHLSRQAGVTLFMTLLAVWQTLLYRYTGQEDIVVGVPIAGRTRRETEPLIGFFVNALALRTRFAGNPTFRELLGRVREVSLGAYAHQDLPFEKLVEELQPERSLSHTPLVQVMFAFQNVPRSSMTLHNVTVEEYEVQRTTAKFDLTLFMWEVGGTLRAEWEYNIALFDAATITRMAGHFQTLLEGIVAYPDQTVATVPLLTDAARQQMLVSWNTTHTAYPRDIGLPQLFEAQVERTPDAVAVVCEEEHLTYRDLHRRANQLAHYLRARGVGPEVRVGLCIERSLQMVVGLLGILKAGGAYVPLDPTYPRERLTFMLADAQAPVLLTQQRLVESFSEYQGHVCCLDTDWEAVAREKSDNLSQSTTGANLAYVIYTSGSTGRPKGVQVSCGALANFVYAMCQRPGLTPQDTLLAVTTISFDIAALELFLPLLVGARLVIVRREVAANGAQLAQTLTAARVTVMQATPATWRLLLETGWHGESRLTILCGGEAFPWSLATQLLARGACLWNMYGPTETTIWSAVHQLQPTDGAVVIGCPIANTQLYVLDSGLQPVPIGVPGELYIGGDGVARGYLNRPDLTAERFLPDPFSTTPGARLYKTGDLARRLPEGTIEFLGRLDQQVKLRGLRIELGEIEAVLEHHPAVRQAAVVLREDTPGDQRLVAYGVCSQHGLPDLNRLQDFMRAKLPDYMVPAMFVWLDALPLTPNGKVDRRALPEPDWTRCELKPTFVAPRDLLEYQMVTTWEQVLGLQPIGIHDNFFMLGGHSLLAVRLCGRLEQVCRTAIPLAMLFQSPTVAALAAVVRQTCQSASPSRLLPYRSHGSKQPFFCVHGVELMAHYLDTEQPFYALHPHALDGRRAPSTIEAMAADYLHDIRTIQPEGPYFLGGGSVGGMIAFEMAQQLRQQGHTVALLVLIDPTRPRYASVERSNVRQWIKGIGKKMATVVVEFYLARGWWIPLKLRMPYFLEVSLQAASKYAPQHYPGRISLLRTAQRDESLQQEWESLADGGMEVYTMPGTHSTMLQEPHVRVLTERLALCLHQAQAGHTTGVLPASE